MVAQNEEITFGKLVQLTSQETGRYLNGGVTSVAGRTPYFNGRSSQYLNFV